MLLMIADMVIVFLVFNFCFHYCRLYINAPDYLYAEALGILVPVYFAVLFLFGTYRSLWRYAQAWEFLLCTIASCSAGAIYFVISRWLFNDKIPFYFYLLIAVSTSMALVAFRLVYRVYRDYATGKKNLIKKGRQKRTVIIGCGDACNRMLYEIKIAKNCDILPVAGIDDDNMKVGKTINGLYIAGGIDDIESVAEKYGAEQILIAIPSATNAERAEIIEKCSKTELEVKILPQLLDFEDEDKRFVHKIRDITPDELLGRDAVDVVNDDVLSFVSGKTVLITGGGGSIGSELSRQVAANKPNQLIIVDIYENNAYDIEQELYRKYGETLNLKVIISSVRDYSRINHIVKTYKPDLIIHAAAHKHVPLMETAPSEAVKNNVFGTLNVALAAKENKVPRMIMISTDKAVNPTNIMGATKRICEMIIQSMNEDAEYTSYSCVRFGNVLGSNGSVIPLFKKQISEGGPVTVTHPDIIRYFMTIPEAVQLVLLTGAIAEGGEIFVLDMGEPVRIVDLAKKMISIAGKKIDIEFIGLRPGEKLFEELLMDEEGMKKTAKNKIYVGKPIEMDSKLLKKQLSELWNIVNDDEISDDVMMSLIEEELHEITHTFKRAEITEQGTPSDACLETSGVAL